MGTMITTPEETREMFRAKIDSREWWVIVAASAHSHLLAETIERTHYAGEANVDFEVTMWPACGTLVCVYFARKPRLSVAALQTVLAGLGGDSPERINEGQDIIFTGDVSRDVIYAFFNFVDR